MEQARPVVVLAMSEDLARAAKRARGLLEEGTPVTFVVACPRCGMAAVEVLAGLRLAARRTRARLDIVVEHESLRALVALAGLTDLLDG